MTTVLRGAELVESLQGEIAAEVDDLKACGIEPTLAIVRVGKREDDISYERGATKRASAVGVLVRNVVLAADATQAELIACIDELNADATVHGVLLFRPLPKHMDEDLIRNILLPEKDIDGITDRSLSGVFTDANIGYAPCTPAACMAILDYFNIETTGKRALVVGRSLVVGKPVAMMLLARNATVTIAHSRSRELPALVRDAELVIACVGRAKMIDAACFAPGQIVIDVGINVAEDGSLVGDADFDAASKTVEAITPVPGGVGTVTTSVLVQHVVEAAKRASGELVCRA
jgi:methylenetetrahydrofolate dehydrogenase (NADP+)/methenyltetrahydrofolate cyclohydrolase